MIPKSKDFRSIKDHKGLGLHEFSPVKTYSNDHKINLTKIPGYPAKQVYEADGDFKG